MTTKLDAAVDAILTGDLDRDEWTALCVATVRMAHAMAEFDHARRRYVAANPPPVGGWPRKGFAGDVFAEDFDDPDAEQVITGT